MIGLVSLEAKPIDCPNFSMLFFIDSRMRSKSSLIFIVTITKDPHFKWRINSGRACMSLCTKILIDTVHFYFLNLEIRVSYFILFIYLYLCYKIFT